MMAPPNPLKSDAAMAPGDQVSRAEDVPAVSPVGYAAVDPQTASEHGAQDIARKPSCLGHSPDGSCISFQFPKVRMVRVPTPAPPAPVTKVNYCELGEPPTSIQGTMESKKAQRSAHRQNQRRNQLPAAMSGSPIGQRGDMHMGTTVARATRVISGEKPFITSYRRAAK